MPVCLCVLPATHSRVVFWCAVICRAQTALVLRFGEKRVLHRTVELVSQVWSMLLVEGWRD